MNKVTEELLAAISDWKKEFKGAFNIRENGLCVGRQCSPNIEITSKTEKSGIDVRVKDGTKGEKVYIPACVTAGNFIDTVYNDIYIGKDCDVTVMAGCGVHTDDTGLAQHDGIHRFYIGENSKVYYEEKHIGTGKGTGEKDINPVTEAYLEKNSYLEMDTTQLSGVSHAKRNTYARLDEGAKLVVKERLLTEGEQTSDTIFLAELNGEGSSCDMVSRSVARGHSHQTLDSTIVGNAPCSGHSECDSIIDGDAMVDASPRLFAHNRDASLIHEAAIGKIAGEQLLKLRTLGLTEEEAEAAIIDGFLEQ